MGRGRAKAKQTKVARRLKYSAPHTDLDALRQELSGQSGLPASDDAHDEHEDDEYGDYDKYADYDYGEWDDVAEDDTDPNSESRDDDSDS